MQHGMDTSVGRNNPILLFNPSKVLLGSRQISELLLCAA
jgi:hypothetical protein